MFAFIKYYLMDHSHLEFAKKTGKDSVHGSEGSHSEDEDQHHQHHHTAEEEK